MIANRVIVIIGFTIMGLCLLGIAWQNVHIAHIAADVSALVIKIH